MSWYPRKAPEELFDVDRLDPEERQLWDEHFSGPPVGDEGPLITIWSFGYACMLELNGPPAVVSDCLSKHDPDNLILQYLENVRRAGRKGEW